MFIVLDQKFKEKLGSVTGKNVKKGKSASVNTEADGRTDDQEADKLEEKESLTQKVEKAEQKMKEDSYVKSSPDLKVCFVLAFGFCLKLMNLYGKPFNLQPKTNLGFTMFP